MNLKRALVFFSIFALGLFAPSYAYLGFRLASETWHWIVLLIPFLAIQIFPFVRLNDIAAHFIFLSMGILTYLFVFTAARDVWLLVSGDLLPAWGVLLGALLSVVTGTIIAAGGPRVKRVVIEKKDLPSDLEGFRIAQISDLHIGKTIGRNYVRTLVERANSEAPDIVVMTGDIGDAPVENSGGQLEELAKLKSKHGIYYVPGNHEFYWKFPEWLRAIVDTGAQALLNQGVKLGVGATNIHIAGIVDPTANGTDLAPNVSSAMSNKSDSAFSVLLSHRPDFAKEALEKGADLVLAGHTHGGQFFPWTIVVRFVHKYSLGHYRIGDRHIYVNGGTGSWGPLLRLGTWPELTILELKRV